MYQPYNNAWFLWLPEHFHEDLFLTKAAPGLLEAKSQIAPGTVVAASASKHQPRRPHHVPKFHLAVKWVFAPIESIQKKKKKTHKF
jgi:hypothetical protein